MPNEAEKAVQSGKELATKKMGPLPVWGWALVAVGVGGAVYFVFLRPKGGAAVDQSGFLGGIGAPIGGGGSGGGGAVGSIPAESPTAPTLTNAMWLEKAVDAVNAAIPGLQPGLARLYLVDYLSGTAPVGSTSSSKFSAVVAAAKQALGDAPTLPTFNNNVNPYTNNITWLQQALGFSQNLGLSQGVRTELTNLAYGTTGTLSREAATALDALRDLIGGEPMPFAYGVNAPPAAPSTPSTPAVDWSNVFSLTKVQALIDTGISFGKSNPKYYENPDLLRGIYRDVFGITDDQAQRAVDSVRTGVTNGKFTDPTTVQNALLAGFK